MIAAGQAVRSRSPLTAVSKQADSGGTASTSLPDNQEDREVYLLVGSEQKLKLGFTICKLSPSPR
jgi:hypothetical protein